MDELLRSLEEKWQKENKSLERRRKLRYYYKNKEKLLGDRRSVRSTKGLVGL